MKRNARQQATEGQMPALKLAHWEARKYSKAYVRSIPHFESAAHAARTSAVDNIGHFGVRAGQEARSQKGSRNSAPTSLGDALHGTGKEAFEAVKACKKANPEQETQAANGATRIRSPFGNSLFAISRS